MTGFSDEVYIDVSSGNGGAGCVSFRREKFVPKGGPDGGDGGKGGDVIFVVRSNLKTLSAFKTRRVYRAGNGAQGSGNRCSGSDGVDVEIAVPPGTCIYDSSGTSLIKDMADTDRYILLKGGRGGQGNWHFRNSVNQAPRYAQTGEEGSSMRIALILKLIADVGLVGFPNAGKSSFINSVTNARSKVAAYPFTTVIPQLGMMRIYDKDILIADIPGLIEGAGEGSGMGIKFLKHIERTGMLLFLIDQTATNYLDEFDILKKELSVYSEALLRKPRIVALTKMDEVGSSNRFSEFVRKYPDERVYPLSVYSKEYVYALSVALSDMV